jgi:hypothetical protein
MGDETWKPVVGFEGWYSVSDQGRVRRDKPGKSTFRGRPLKPYIRRDGYPCVRFCCDAKTKGMAIHRLVAAAFLGPCPVGKEVNHRNGNRSDPCASNLEYVTRSENNLHAYRILGGGPRCIVKIDNEQLSRLRALHLVGVTQKELARMFGIHQSHVSKILSGHRRVRIA